jgi:hypothetical protein
MNAKLSASRRAFVALGAASLPTFRCKREPPGGKLKMMKLSLRGPFPILQPDGKLGECYGDVKMDVNEINSI